MLITNFPQVRDLIRRREALQRFLDQWNTAGATTWTLSAGVEIPWNRVRNAVEAEILKCEADLQGFGVTFPPEEP